MTYNRNAPRPHLRKYPDPVDHKLFMDWMRAKAQAAYMALNWTVPVEEYIAMWRQNDLYKEKGRHNHEYCLVRKDYGKGWHLDNVHIITRGDHYEICSREKIGKFAERKKNRLEKQHVN